MTTTAHHLCIVCGAYGPRSPDFGKTWSCQQHDPHRDKDLKPQTAERPSSPSWDPCQCCDGQGCPWCQPERYGLPPRNQFTSFAAIDAAKASDAPPRRN